MNTQFELNTERTVVLSALTGSHNYNLNTPKSDRDYKVFVLPSFSDLYYGKTYSGGSQSPTVDYTVHDIRKLLDLLAKGNITFLEVLFSKDVVYNPQLTYLFQYRETIVNSVLFTFKASTYGTFHQKMEGIFKGTATTQEDVDRLGYDPKAACHALRCLYTLERYARYESFERALWYDDDDPMRQTLLDVKAGLYPTFQDFKVLVDNWMATENAFTFEYYDGKRDNKNVISTLQDFAFGFVRDNM